MRSRTFISPFGVSTYRVTRELPEPLQAYVPPIEDLDVESQQVVDIEP